MVVGTGEATGGTVVEVGADRVGVGVQIGVSTGFCVGVGVCVSVSSGEGAAAPAR